MVRIDASSHIGPDPKTTRVEIRASTTTIIIYARQQLPKHDRVGRSVLNVPKFYGYGRAKGTVRIKIVARSPVRSSEPLAERIAGHAR